MTDDTDRLYELLPVVYQRRDAEQGYPLKALLRVIGEQVDLVEADIERLYDDWFIETCDDWVVPYIADLIGYRRVEAAGLPGDPQNTAQGTRNRVLIPRREVAKTIRYRRRKGTLALLEQLALDIAGWPARAVEFRKLISQTQSVNHLHLERGKTVDLRDGNLLNLIHDRHIEDAGRPGLAPAEVAHEQLTAHGAFDELAHTVDVRRIDSHLTAGRYNLPDVGLFVFRLKSYSVTKTRAAAQRFGAHCFTFSPLGNDQPLFLRPNPEEDPNDIAGELNLPVPIRRRVFESTEWTRDKTVKHASPMVYGINGSVAIWAVEWAGHSKGHNDSVDPIPAEKVIPANLSDWHYLPPPGFVAVDPVLGRITFPPKQFPRSGVLVSYNYGCSADIGGGEYAREVSQPDGAVIYHVGTDSSLKSIQKAKEAWLKDQPQHAVIEITDNRTFREPINFDLPAGASLQLRAKNGCRPILWLSESTMWATVAGAAESRFTFDGLMIAGLPVNIQGELSHLTIRHCTLLPGSTIQHNCEPDRPAEPSLILLKTQASLCIQNSIIGSIQIKLDEVGKDPIAIRIDDSILDATDSHQEAIGSDAELMAHAVLTMRRSTVLGYIEIHAVELAENSIFTGHVRVARRQRGCMRFCYVDAGLHAAKEDCSRTPRRYRCQPDLALQQLKEQDTWDGLPPDEQRELQRNERLRVRPVFNALRYGLPTYCQLAISCAEEIKRGADDESEMGAFHDLYEPQRFSNLDTRLDEYTPADTDAGIILST